MAAEFDATDFVDEDFHSSRPNSIPTPPMNAAPEDPRRAPTREEVDSKLVELQTKLADLKREQSEIERERSTFEETRRRQVEFTTGREELIRDLSRGIPVLEETQFATRRDAEQMGKALEDLKDSLAKLQAIQEATWTKESLNSELSRAMGVVDHARMEWNSARLKFAVLTANPGATADTAEEGAVRPASPLAGLTFAELARIGLAFTWPVLVGALAIVIALLVRR